ncbi:hypothetical protein NECAME_08968 [Necator americanus]|uniref:Uncharacterized protein n=1 Tax=Necator americanus TaxID=51031 RepID=W2TIC6_NECAM|nr:hypothetical protein NECAME_08968 [Necator americanus]ETN80762.1 hypothetical protein NECAME_08968 [Necator americanus]
MSAVEERTAEKRPLNDKEDSNEVAAKEPRIENGKTEDEVQVIKEKSVKGEGDDDEGDSGEEEDGDDAEGGEESD